MKKSACLAVLAVAGLMNSCSSTTKIPAPAEMLREATGQNGRACIRTHNIQGYGVLQNNIVSKDGMRKYYLATVLPGCNDLHTSIGAMFSGDFGEVCGRTTNKIKTQRDSCVINQMFEFNSREEALEVYNTMQKKRAELQEAGAQAADE